MANFIDKLAQEFSSDMMQPKEMDTVNINGKRYYMVGGIPFPSVSTILQTTLPAKDRAILARWRKKVGEEEANRISKAACYRGTALHSQIENLFTGKSYKHEYLNDATQLTGYLSNCSPLGIEKKIAHPELKYAGRYDCYLQSPKGYKTLIDWKTSSKFKPIEYCRDYFLQLTAYAIALEHCGHKPDLLSVVVFYKNEKPNIYTVPYRGICEDTKQDYYLMFLARLKEFWEMEKARNQA